MSPQEFDDVLFSLDDNNKIIFYCVREFLVTDLLNKHVDQGVDKLGSTTIYFEQESCVKEKRHTNYSKNLTKVEPLLWR